MICNLRTQLFALDNLMGELGIRYVVTGTLAMGIMGLPMSDAPNDIDIKVYPKSHEAEQALAALHRAAGTGASPYKDCKCFTFFVCGVKVNAIVEEGRPNHAEFVKIAEYDHADNTLRHIRVQNLTEAIMAKMKLGRNKDHDFLCDVVMRIACLGRRDTHTMFVGAEQIENKEQAID